MLTKRWWPIGANRLIDCEARFADGDRPLTLFPFFDGQGDVRCLLGVDQDAGEVRVLPDDVSITITLMSLIHVRVGWLELMPFDDVNLINETWHFDPMWKLDLPSLRNHPLREDLKETNCVNEFLWAVDNLYFDSRMQRVKWVHKHTSSENAIKKFKPDHLPEAPCLIDGAIVPPERQGPTRKRWVLNPIWMAKRSRA